MWSVDTGITEDRAEEMHKDGVEIRAVAHRATALEKALTRDRFIAIVTFCAGVAFAGVLCMASL